MVYQKVPSSTTSTTTTTIDPAMVTRGGYLPYLMGLVVVVWVTFSSFSDNSFSTVQPTKVNPFINEIFGELLSSSSMFDSDSDSEPTCDDLIGTQYSPYVNAPCHEEIKNCYEDSDFSKQRRSGDCYSQFNTKVTYCVTDNLDPQTGTVTDFIALNECLLQEAQRDDSSMDTDDTTDDAVFIASREADAVIKCVIPIYQDCYKNNPPLLDLKYNFIRHPL